MDKDCNKDPTIKSKNATRKGYHSAFGPRG